MPWSPGSGPDITARVIATALARQMGETIVVDNRPGASSVIGIEIIARAVPDGYTIGQGNFPMVTNRILLPSLPYDPDRDIQPISQYTRVPNILVVTLSLPVKSVQDLVDYARKNPGKLLFASGGNGTSPHLSGELFKRMANIQMTHVPYKSSPQAIIDMIGGQIPLYFENASGISAHVRAGRVRGLAVTTAKRSPSYPELPTVAESGVPNFEVAPWAGIIAPSGLPKSIVNRLNTEVNKALATSAVKEQFAVTGNELVGGTPEEFAALIKRETAKWAEVIKGANIKVD